MKRLLLNLMTGVLGFLLFASAPAVLFAEEYSLDDLCRIALTRSEKLKIAEENVTISEIGQDKARSFLLPSVTAQGEHTRYSEKKLSATGSVIQPESASSWGILVDETVSLSGREWAALDISKENVTRSRYDLTAVREDYLLRFVAAAYYNVLLAQKSLEIADANLERLMKYRDAAEKRLKIGEVTKTVLLRAEGELSGAQSDRLQAQNDLKLAKAVLASNVGIKDAFTLREAPAEEAELPDVTVFQAQAIAERADLRSMVIQRQMAADQIRFAEGAFWPSVSLSAAYGGSDQYPGSANINRESIYGSVALNFPLFEGGFRKAEVREAKALERQAGLSYEDLKKSIQIEVQTVHLDLVTQMGILKFLDDQLIFARDNYRAVTRQFEFGLSTSLDVMDANTLLVSAERKASSATYNYRLALLMMKKATGRLLEAVAGK
jgi:outer membrane protein